MNDVSSNQSWKALLAKSVTTAEELARHLAVDVEAVAAVAGQFPLRINPYYLSLIKRPGDPIWRQAVPDAAELADPGGTPDPLCEEATSPVAGVVRRYPDRVVFLVSECCAMHCRFCMRKRRVADPSNAANREAGLAYIRRTPAIREVILSGGDPLMLDDDLLFRLLDTLRNIDHVRLIRIHSRMPCTLPQRITDDLVGLLKDVGPVYLNTHFNHPAEITPRSAEACRRLVDAGIVVGNQNVLLQGINDDPAVMHELLETLLTLRVRPYYLHQVDRVCGTGHFAVPVQKGLAIMDHLRGRLSGMGVPHYMVDLPGGGGKVPLTPDYVVDRKRDHWVIRNFEGQTFNYPV